MKQSIKKLFSEYEKLFNDLNVEGQAKFFADSFLSAGPKGAIAMSKDEFLKMAKKAAEFYKSVGQTSARIVTMEETPISDDYSMVTVHWASTFKKTGDNPIEFDVTYFVQTSDSEPKIIMFIAHQDEQEAMKKLGLLSSAQS